MSILGVFILICFTVVIVALFIISVGRPPNFPNCPTRDNDRTREWANMGTYHAEEETEKEGRP